MSKKRLLLTGLALLAVLLVLGSGVSPSGEAAGAWLPAGDPALAGTTIPYAGRLAGDDGRPAAAGSYDLSFALYETIAAGASLWSEVQQVAVAGDGTFQALLGSARAIPPAALAGSQRWLEVAVRGPGQAAWSTLTPRLRLQPAEAAARAAEGQGLSCAHDHFGETWAGDGVGLILHSFYDYGLLAISDRTGEGTGVHGEGTLRGVYGEATTNTPNAAGVVGVSTATTGNVKGVVAESYSTNAGSALVGVSHGNRHAAWIETGNFVSTGIQNNGAGYAALEVANAASGGYAAKFWGNVAVYGNLSKSGGGFRIDHPLDPANRYLNHSFVESPERLDVYNGNVVLDEGGAAWVELPAYFEALNRDFVYQLTPVGAAASSLHVAQEIAGNRFRIAGGPAGIKVSWQVTGIRQDPWAAANPLVVEEPKPEGERGLYLHPALYGRPRSAGIGIKSTTDPQ